MGSRVIVTDQRNNETFAGLPRQLRDELPPDRLTSYARLWQFETWLREMVYVELRSRYGDNWMTRIAGSSARAQSADRRLTYMPTRETYPTNYVTLETLLRTIGSNWYLFKPYLPARSLWRAKIDEVSQIRNRVAHFRRGHTDDLKRIEQLLRDIDAGFWQFCTSYNDSRPVLPPTNDPVIREFLELDPFPWSEIEDNEWARIGIADPNETLAVQIEVLRRQWLNSRVPRRIPGKYGYLYNVMIMVRGNRNFDYANVLRNTRSIHSSLCHICLTSSSDTIRATIPAILGQSRIIELIRKLVQAGRNGLRPGRPMPSFDQLLRYSDERTRAMDQFVQQWPEYVLGPSNALTFLAPDMPCSIFGVD